MIAPCLHSHNNIGRQPTGARFSTLPYRDDRGRRARQGQGPGSRKGMAWLDCDTDELTTTHTHNLWPRLRVKRRGCHILARLVQRASRERWPGSRLKAPRRALAAHPHRTVDTQAAPEAPWAGARLGGTCLARLAQSQSSTWSADRACARRPATGPESVFGCRFSTWIRNQYLDAELVLGCRINT